MLQLHSAQLSFSSDKSYLPGNYQLSLPQYSEEQIPSVWSKHHSQPVMPSLKPQLSIRLGHLANLLVQALTEAQVRVSFAQCKELCNIPSAKLLILSI